MIQSIESRFRCIRTAAKFAVWIALLSALWASMTGAGSARTKAGRIEIEYVLPTDPAHRPLLDRLKQARALEYLQGLLGSIRLPRPLKLVLTGCHGMSNAMYGNDAVTVCYEFLDEIVKNAVGENLPAGITKTDAVVGPLLDVFLHEAGHAIFEYLNVPIFGKEEDAADQFSAYIMLQYDKDRARRLILGSAYQYKMDVKDAEMSLARNKFADEHGVPAQRFFNVLCIAYGYDSKLFADLVEKHYLPIERAVGCEREYRQVQFAFKTLISPHVVRTLARRAFQTRAGVR